MRRPAEVELGQVWQYMSQGNARIYVVVDGPRCFEEEGYEQAMLLDLERGTQRRVNTAVMTDGWRGCWSLFEP